MSFLVVQEVSNNNYKKELKTLVEQVTVFQQYQKKLKQQLKLTEEIIMDLNMKSRLSKLLSAIEQEKETYYKLLFIFRRMESVHQTPYLILIRQFTQIINQHHQHYQAAHKDPETHIQQITSKRVIWQQQDKSEHVIFFVVRGFLGLLGAFMIHLLIGGLYRWGMINAFITSYYKITNNPDLTMPIDSINTPLSMLFVTLSMRIGIKMKQYVGIIPVLFLSFFAMPTTIYISGFMPTIQLFSVFHIAGYGLAAGLSFTITIKQMITYFPDWKLYINTIILTGTGLGAALFGLQNSQCMNPFHYYPLQTGYYSGQLDQISYRMPVCITQMSLLVAFLGGIGILFMFPVIFYNIRKSQEQKKLEQKQDFQFSCHTIQQAFQSHAFWAIVLIIILSSCGNFYIVSNYKDIVKDSIQDVVFLDFVFLIGWLFNGSFRLVWGLTIGKFGLKFLYIFAMILNIFVFGMIPLLSQYRQAYIVLYAINSIVAGGQVVIFASISILVFGSFLGQQIFSLYMFAFTLANFGNFGFGKFIKPLLGEYVFAVFIILSVFGMILMIITKLQGKWENPMHLLTLSIPIWDNK